MTTKKYFQIKESPEGDWNKQAALEVKELQAFKLKNPRKGTETTLPMASMLLWFFQIKESPEGDWNSLWKKSLRVDYNLSN